MKLKLLMTRKREETQKKDDVNDQNSGVLRFGGQLKDRSTASSHLFRLKKGTFIFTDLKPSSPATHFSR